MHRHPGSQNSALLREKELLARKLLGRGLTITQVCAQLNCSRGFIRRILREQQEGREGQTGSEVAG